MITLMTYIWGMKQPTEMRQNLLLMGISGKGGNMKNRVDLFDFIKSGLEYQEYKKQKKQEQRAIYDKANKKGLLDALREIEPDLVNQVEEDMRDQTIVTDGNVDGDHPPGWEKTRG